jgi:acyl dehydratase
MKDFEARTEFVVADWAQLGRVISEHDVIAFAKIAGDHNSLHANEESARRTRFKIPSRSGDV